MGEDQDLLVQLARAVAKQRGYADFFDWPDKRQKELGLLETFVEAVAGISHLRLSTPRLTQPGEDPPDALAQCAAEGEVGIELTEFVDQGLIKRQRKTGEAQWRAWSRDEFRAAVEEVVRRKDCATLRTPHAPTKYWIVIHIDEPALTPDQLSSYLSGFVVGQCRLITRCFVLMSYHPQANGYPVFEVPVERAA